MVSPLFITPMKGLIFLLNSVDQHVINFIADYTGTSPAKINNSTTLSNLGIVSILFKST